MFPRYIGIAVFKGYKGCSEDTRGFQRILGVFKGYKGCSEDLRGVQRILGVFREY